MDAEFSWPIRVYYEDTDLFGVVYHTNYIKYMERARTEWLRWLGFGQDRLRQDHDLVFAVRSVTLDYLMPARFDDQLIVETNLVNLGHVSMHFIQSIFRIQGDGQELLARGQVKLACLDVCHWRPMHIPQSIMEVVKGVC